MAYAIERERDKGNGESHTRRVVLIQGAP